MQNLKNMPPWSKLLIKITLLIIILISIGFLFVYDYLNKINYSGEAEAAQSSKETSDTADDFKNEPNAENKDLNNENMTLKNKDIINILLIGQDKRPGEGRSRSDSMIIASINKKKSSIKLTSLMRDMYVPIPGYGENKINSAYALGGMELLSETIEDNFMIQIDGCVEIDFSGFTKAIDIIGGIDNELNEDEAWYLNKKHNFNLTAGMNHLSGEEALEYSRIRYIGNDDYERTERQRKVLIAAYDKLKDTNIKTLLELADEILPLVTTDLTKTQILELIATVLFLDVSDIETYRIPADGEFITSTVDGMSVLLPDLEDNRELLKQYIGY